jgi:flagellar biosynthesis/type III secretory pathway chaperone
MQNSDKIIAKSDRLIDILTAQCTDLEALLALARSETAAAERKDFEEIMEIVTKRSEISQRFETFQQQIGELRGFLGNHSEGDKYNDVTNRVIEIANQTIIQDRKTDLLLNQARESAAKGLQNSQKQFRCTNAYLHDTHKGLAYTRDI